MVSTGSAAQQARVDQSREEADQESTTSTGQFLEVFSDSAGKQHEKADAESAEMTGRQWERNFHLLSICIGMNHAAEDTFGLYGPEIWRSNGQVVTYAQGCTTMSVWMLTSLFLAVPISQRFGPKALVISGLMLYNMRYIVDVIASVLPAGSTFMHVVGIVGAACVGIGSTCMYAGEGVFFARTAELVAKMDGKDLSEVTSHVASIFAFWYLMIEFASKMTFWGLREVGVPFHLTLGVMLALPLGATVAACLIIRPVPSQEAEENQEIQSKVTCKVVCKDGCQTLLLWRDLRIWLISPLVMSFGVAAAFLNGKIANNYVTPEVGPIWKALFSAGLTLVAALLCWPFKFLAGRCGKGPVLAVGAVTIIVLPSLFLLMVDESLRFDGWLIIFYLLQGIIRALYAGISKAVYADQFPGPDSEAAMSNWSMHAGLGFTVTTFMEVWQVDPIVFGYMLLVLGCFLMPGYWAALFLQRRMSTTQNADPTAKSEDTEIQVPQLV